MTIKDKETGSITCNMCYEQMNYISGIAVCINPACPNYALLQVSVEVMEKAGIVKSRKGKDTK